MKKLNTDQKIEAYAQIYAIVGVLMWLAAVWYIGAYAILAVIALIAIPGSIASAVLTARKVHAMG
ncbi:MAG: hypothetical protein WAV98_02595 [Minisyncoccia bacterium]